MRKNFFIIALAALFMASCGKPTDEKAATYVPPQELVLESDIMTPEVLWSMNRLGEYAVSPDGKSVVYNLTYFIIEENKSKTDIYVIDIDGNNNRCLTQSFASEYSPTWNNDGSKILFMSAASGEMQVWEMNPDGSGRKQVSFVDGGIGGFEYSPDESQLLYTAEVKLKDNVADIYPDLQLSSGRINNDLMYRHWDQWVDTYGHIFITTDNGKNTLDIMEGEMWEAPVRPWGGLEQVTWTNDGQNILYSCRKKVGKEYATSTNTDIYKYNIPTGECVNLTEGMMGYDMNVVVSPQGDKIAWESMERDGYEADKQRLFVMDLNTGEKKD